jgi:ATP/maltotriose-dependent transcriptional regulator MalT
MGKHPTIQCWHNLATSSYHRYTDDDISKQLELASTAVDLYEQAGAVKTMLVLARDVFGELLARSGRVDEAIALLRGSLATAEALDMRVVLNHARLALANVFIAQGTFERAAEAETLVKAILEASSITRGYQAMTGFVIAQIFLVRGEMDRAMAEIARAIELSEHTPTRRFQMVALQIDLLLRKDEHAAAADVARAALADLEQLGQGGYGELPLLAAAAEALVAAGATAEGDVTLRRAHDKLLRQAAGFAAEPERVRFLRDVPLHARIVDLAASRFG